VGCFWSRGFRKGNIIYFSFRVPETQALKERGKGLFSTVSRKPYEEEKVARKTPRRAHTEMGKGKQREGEVAGLERKKKEGGGGLTADQKKRRLICSLLIRRKTWNYRGGSVGDARGRKNGISLEGEVTYFYYLKKSSGKN